MGHSVPLSELGLRSEDARAYLIELMIKPSELSSDVLSTAILDLRRDSRDTRVRRAIGNVFKGHTLDIPRRLVRYLTTCLNNAFPDGKGFDHHGPLLPVDWDRIAKGLRTSCKKPDNVVVGVDTAGKADDKTAVPSWKIVNGKIKYIGSETINIKTEETNMTEVHEYSKQALLDKLEERKKSADELSDKCAEEAKSIMADAVEQYLETGETVVVCLPCFNSEAYAKSIQRYIEQINLIATDSVHLPIGSDLLAAAVNRIIPDDRKVSVGHCCKNS